MNNKNWGRVNCDTEIKGVVINTQKNPFALITTMFISCNKVFSVCL